MNTAHRQQSRAKRQQLPPQLPKFWRAPLSQAQQLDCKLIHWDLIDRFTSGTATADNLWEWVETGATYSQMMRLLMQDGTEFTPEALEAVAEQISIYDSVATRYARTGRVGFSAPELLIARAAASVFDQLVEIDRHGIAERAAIDSALMVRQVRAMAAAGRIRSGE